MKKETFLILWSLIFVSLLPAEIQAAEEDCSPSLFRSAEQGELSHENSLKLLIREVSHNQIPPSLSSCGENCFQINSPLTQQPRIIKIDPQLNSPFQEGPTLSIPSLELLDHSSLRRLLIGHELHPYLSNFFQSNNLLRPSQRMAIDDFKVSLNQGYGSYLYISPTSTGKSSVLAQNLLEKLTRKSGKKISFITADKIKLVDQLNSEIQSEAHSAHFDLQQIHWIAKEKKSFSDEIEQALRQKSPTVISITLRSFLIQMESLKEKEPLLYQHLIESLDGIWIDEVHHLGASQTRDFILDLKNKSRAFLYGTTATPVHRDVLIQQLFDKVHWSYLEEGNFERHPPSMVVDQLISSIERGDITPFNDIFVLLGESMERKRILEISDTPFFIQRHENSLFSINPYYYEELVEGLSVIFERNRKGMIIVSTIRESEELAAFLRDKVEGIRFESYHSEMSGGMREEVFRNSREEEGHYIVAVRALDEGVNLPHLSAYIDLNPHISVKQVVHRIGRVLRPVLGKMRADIFILSSYKNSSQVRELMDSVERIREGVRIFSGRGAVSASESRLRELSDRSYEFFVEQEEFWSEGRGVELRNRRKERVLALIRDNERMTRQKLIKLTGWSEGTIKNIISELKKEQKVETVGTGSHNFYRVLEEGDDPPLGWEEQKKQRKE
ncbi:MAG: helicase-related protein, partial [Bdellovibrionales bacterium]|nr:helicase-related protein [Bdellovibrionales bacterium]